MAAGGVRLAGSGGSACSGGDAAAPDATAARRAIGGYSKCHRLVAYVYFHDGDVTIGAAFLELCLKLISVSGMANQGLGCFGC